MSRLTVLDKYKDATDLQLIPLSKEYWKKDAELQEALSRENEARKLSITMSTMKFYKRFTM